VCQFREQTFRDEVAHLDHLRVVAVHAHGIWKRPVCLGGGVLELSAAHYCLAELRLNVFLRENVVDTASKMTPNNQNTHKNGVYFGRPG
jgi:hypothetical protein